MIICMYKNEGVGRKFPKSVVGIFFFEMSKGT